MGGRPFPHTAHSSPFDELRAGRQPLALISPPHLSGRKIVALLRGVQDGNDFRDTVSEIEYQDIRDGVPKIPDAVWKISASPFAAAISGIRCSSQPSGD